MNKLSTLIETYLSYLRYERNASPKTLENYKLWLNRLVEHIWDIAPDQITLFVILDYRKALNKRWLNIKTINYHIVALRAFLKFLFKNDIKTLSPEKIDLAKTPPRTVNFLNEDEVEKIFEVPAKIWKNPFQIARDEAILLVLYWSGLRVSELISLTKENIKFESNQFWVVGKWSKLRWVFMTSKAKEALRKYLWLRNDNIPYLFINISNNHRWSSLTRVSIENLVKRYAKFAWITKKVTPHTLRHSFATSLLRKWADIRSVQALLWHSSITTTQIYTHVTDKHLEKVHDLLNDL